MHSHSTLSFHLPLMCATHIYGNIKHKRHTEHERQKSKYQQPSWHCNRTLKISLCENTDDDSQLKYKPSQYWDIRNAIHKP